VTVFAIAFENQESLAELAIVIFIITILARANTVGANTVVWALTVSGTFLTQFFLFENQWQHNSQAR
jgi:hypothetical protein